MLIGALIFNIWQSLFDFILFNIIISIFVDVIFCDIFDNTNDDVPLPPKPSYEC